MVHPFHLLPHIDVAEDLQRALTILRAYILILIPRRGASTFMMSGDLGPYLMESGLAAGSGGVNQRL
jgi:hypothetical protein